MPASAPRAADNPPAEPVRTTQPAAPIRPPEVTLPPLAGTWVASRAARNASPLAAVSVRVILSDTGGWITGTLTGTYQVPRKTQLDPHVAISFAGPGGGKSLKFPFSAADGSKGTLEIIRLPAARTPSSGMGTGRVNLAFDDRPSGQMSPSMSSLRRLVFIMLHTSCAAGSDLSLLSSAVSG
jgi:hypothetical protein